MNKDRFQEPNDTYNEGKIFEIKEDIEHLKKLILAIQDLQNECKNWTTYANLCYGTLGETKRFMDSLIEQEQYYDDKLLQIEEKIELLGGKK